MTVHPNNPHTGSDVAQSKKVRVSNAANPLDASNILGSAPHNTSTSFSQFTISMCNIRGLNANIDSVHHHLLIKRPHLFCLTETQICPLDPSNLENVSPHLFCPGYEFFSGLFPRGGICVFVRCDVQVTRVDELNRFEKDFQVLWLKVNGCDNVRFYCTIYRSPNSKSNYKTLFDHLSNNIERILVQFPQCEISILGDFNVHNPNWLAHSSTRANAAGLEAESFAIVNHLEQLVTCATRIPDRASDSANTLDLFLTTNPSKFKTPLASAPIGNSDHCLISIVQTQTASHRSPLPSSQQRYNFQKADWDRLREFFSGDVPWSSFSDDEPSELADSIVEWIHIGMQLAIPSSIRAGRLNSPKWFNRRCSRAVNVKNKMFHAWKKCKTSQNRATFTQARNACSNTIREAKATFMENIYNKIENSDPKAFWSLVKSISSNFCQSSFPDIAKPDGTMACDPVHKAETFASHFSATSNVDDSGHVFAEKESVEVEVMSKVRFNAHNVARALQRLKANKSPGPDGIPAILLKNCAKELSPHLAKLFNLSYSSGIFPTSWKLAHVFPIPKKGDKSMPSNYRPIALTSLLSKTMESIIVDKLFDHLEKYNLLSDHQYGFRKARSTGDLLAYVCHAWSSAIEAFGESRIISLDISKAFDRVWHKALLAKLPSFGVTPCLLNWIENFLSNRSIAVRIDGHLSSNHSINAGVPQGSVLSPVLFLMFINDLLSSVTSSVHSYADDTYLSASYSFLKPKEVSEQNISLKRTESAQVLSNDLINVSKWGEDNLVRFNTKKTDQIIISRKRNRSFPDIAMGEDILPLSEHLPQLGLRVTSDLHWNDHIFGLAKKASQKLAYLFRARKYFPSDKLLVLYKSLIRPQLEFNSHIWGGAPKSLLAILDRIQRKAIRLIDNQLLTKHLQPLEHRRRVAALCLYYRYFFGHCSDELQSNIPPILVFSRNTRFSSGCHGFCVSIPFVRTGMHSSSFFVRVSHLWNKLPRSVFPEGHVYNLQGFKQRINCLDLCSIF